MVVLEPCALGGLAELGQQRGEAVGIVVVGHVTGALEDLEAAARHRRVRGGAVRDGDDRVALAPHDQRRQPRGQREPVVRAHALATGLDHRAHRVQERLARARVVERGEAAREDSDVAGRLRGRRGRADRRCPRPSPTSRREVSAGST